MAMQKVMLNSRSQGIGRKWACILLVLVSASAASSQHIVETLPGFPGKLSFKLETGEDFEYNSDLRSEINAKIAYFSFKGGPLKFHITDYTGGLPSLIYEPDAWTKTANIIFIDAPVGAGFSYATAASAYPSTDTSNTAQMQAFLRNWWRHIQVSKPIRCLLAAILLLVYILQCLLRRSYEYTSSFLVPKSAGNEAGFKLYVHIKEMILSCPHTFTDLETNSKIPFAHRLALISDALYKSLEENCGGNFVGSTNTTCTEDLAAYDELIELISKQNVLEPDCSFLSPKSKEACKSAISNQEKHSRPRDLWCKNFDYLLSDIWGNYPSVQDALGVRQGTVSEFFRCNISLSYTVDVDNVLDYHKNLTSLGMQVLVFSGDHDMVIPHNGIEEWINWLDLTTDIDWRPWFVDGQVAGYTTKYIDGGYRLTYATLKGSGHSPPEYKCRECYEMFHRWIHYYPL
ncbi:hypothetical protein BT93_G0408 [Corymbia citriodora subsp. variegata]|nr:hypothetical protein BT93_G0408 [Corymbia citriodora subsp. variegata]